MRGDRDLEGLTKLLTLERDLVRLQIEPPDPRPIGSVADVEPVLAVPSPPLDDQLPTAALLPSDDEARGSDLQAEPLRSSKQSGPVSRGTVDGP
jgi:hypothetical protein